MRKIIFSLTKLIIGSLFMMLLLLSCNEDKSLKRAKVYPVIKSTQEIIIDSSIVYLKLIDTAYKVGEIFEMDFKLYTIKP